MKFGSRNNYFWIEWESLSLRDLLSSVPTIVLDRYLVNTSFDSGKLILSESEIQNGWHSEVQFAYSPKIRMKELHEIPHDCFDEWLAFTEPNKILNWEPIVNYSDFSLLDPDFHPMQTTLWSQLGQANPESYFADGDRLIFITRNESLYKAVLLNSDLESSA